MPSTGCLSRMARRVLVHHRRISHRWRRAMTGLILQGLDRAEAPSPAQATSMLAAVGGRWWAVYLGGPDSGGSGWGKATVDAYHAAGIDAFLPLYVGHQQASLLTPTEALATAQEAVSLMHDFGFAGGTV